MTRVLLALLLIAGVMGTPVRAQDARPANDAAQLGPTPEPVKPCTRDPRRHIAIYGKDLDEISCERALLLARIAGLVGDIEGLRAKLTLEAADAKAAREAEAQRMIDLDAWFKGYFGTEK